MKRIFLLLTLLMPATLLGQLKVAGVFGDNAVIQQGKPIPVWGTASSGASVSVGFAGFTVTTKAGDDGKWRLLLPAMQADGSSHTLTVVSGGENVVFGNLKLGEVWLSSGQSNMEYRVGDGIVDFEREVAEADYPDIRYLSVGLSPAAEPREDMPNRAWNTVTPESVLTMSAVSYFFARGLHLDRGVPVGIIVAARGATEIGTWISSPMLATNPIYRDRVAGFVPDEWRERERSAERHQFIRDSIHIHSFRGLKEGVIKTGYDDSHWAKVKFPFGLWQLTGGDFWGVIWFRKHFTLTHQQSRKDWTLVLPVNDVGDIQYVNGREVGRKNSIMPELLEIPLSPTTLRKGDNVFGLRMTTTWGLCNIGNEVDNECYLVAADGDRIDMRGEWLYNFGIEPRMPSFSGYYNEPAVNFNGMIAPIAGYGIRGFIWYQGEGNTGYHPEKYTELKSMLIEDWRIRWGQGYLPFLYVQLANMNPHSDLPRDYDGWAVLRDSQTALMDAVPAVGMASAVDIGEWNNAHPLNKQDVGARLYLAAKANAYGQDVEWSGPILDIIERDGDSLVISYTHASSGLKTSDGAPPAGFAVKDAAEEWHWAEARIEGSAIIVDVSGIESPTRLQYAWQANPEANLYNAEGLPAIPFNIAISE